MTSITVCLGHQLMQMGLFWEQVNERGRGKARERERVRFRQKSVCMCAWIQACVKCAVCCMCTRLCTCVFGCVVTSNYGLGTDGDPCLWNMLGNLISSCIPHRPVQWRLNSQLSSVFYTGPGWGMNSTCSPFIAVAKHHCIKDWTPKLYSTRLYWGSFQLWL